MKQSQIFLESEGRAWYERNKDKLAPKDDPVCDLIKRAGIAPNNVVEFGCANGWRLDRLSHEYGCNVYGVDPYSRWPNVIEGTAADAIPASWNNKFDLVIYGFCLYLVDREDLFKVVWNGDRILQDGGYLVIHDFFPTENHKRKYKHCEGLFSYKMDHSNLWLANPTYNLCGISGIDSDGVAVVILKKNIEKGWPLREE